MHKVSGNRRSSLFKGSARRAKGFFHQNIHSPPHQLPFPAFIARHPAIELPVSSYGLEFPGSELPFSSPIVGFPGRELPLGGLIAGKAGSIARQPAFEAGCRFFIQKSATPRTRMTLKYLQTAAKAYGFATAFLGFRANRCCKSL